MHALVITQPCPKIRYPRRIPAAQLFWLLQIAILDLTSHSWWLLSKMAKLKKKGEAGQAKNYITRTQAVRKLQITLPDFRRLCIFKGIYPREPRNLKKANRSASHSTTFYYTKDIQYLLHEPLLAKFREQKALSKKIARSLGRNEVHDAVRLEKFGTPKIRLDHIIRERYPTFVDALRDLDDALSLLFLFANLPSTTTVPPKVINRCQRLCHEFEHYLITANSLKKSFLSIKGIYYQATIQGQDIMWLVPYRFVQRVTQDVDYRIMGTFVEFYCTLLGFVNYRLYTSIGLVYPPRFDNVKDDKGAELAAFTLEGRGLANNVENGETQNMITNGHSQTENSAEVQAALDQVRLSGGMEDNADGEGDEEEQPSENTGIDTFEIAAPAGENLQQPEPGSDRAGKLFSQMTFFIAREAPRHPVELLLRAFGCRRIGWDEVHGDGAFTNNELDSRITHHVVDRPPVVGETQHETVTDAIDGRVVQRLPRGHIVLGRVYIQPQWIWDCVNEANLLRTDLYAPGATLPPHLSPWMKPMNGQYDPRASLADQELEGEIDEAGIEIEPADKAETERAGLEAVSRDGSSETETDQNDMDVASSQEDDEANEVNETDQKISLEANQDEENNFAGFDEEEFPDEEDQHQAELEAEALGLPATTSTFKSSSTQKPKVVSESKAKSERDTEKRRRREEIERAKMMMSNKKRKLYEKMTYGNERKNEEAKKLRAKRRKLESG